MALLQLSQSDVIKDAQTINVFREDSSYALSSFIREVDTVLLLAADQPKLQLYIHLRVIINKIQGPALHILRTLGANLSWNVIKKALIKSFGVKESYDELYKMGNVAKKRA